MAKKNIFYGYMKLDSMEELYICYYLQELQDFGFIHSWDRSGSFYLSDALDGHYTEITQLKTKQKVTDKRVCILESHLYTPDFKIIFTDKYKTLLSIFPDDYRKGHLFVAHEHTDGFLCYLESKPDYDKFNMERIFRVNQKWVFKEHQKIVNLVKFKALFKSTFTPKKYLLTDTFSSGRKINWKIKTIEEYARQFDN